jgi:small subunit ribosomal protein S17e
MEGEFMGKVKNTAIKTLAEQLILEHTKKFNDDFEHNKKVLDELKPIKSKKIRNIIAGYITRRMKKIKETGI